MPGTHSAGMEDIRADGLQQGRRAREGRIGTAHHDGNGAGPGAGGAADDLQKVSGIGAKIALAVLFDDGHLGGFAVSRVLSEQLCLIEPASAPPAARAGRSLSLRQALAQPLILPASPHGVRPIIEAAAAAAGLPPSRVEADISSISILRTTLLAGLGRTLLPVMPLQADIEAGLLRATPVNRLERVLAVCSSAHIPRSPACRAVAGLAVSLMQQLSAQGHWKGTKRMAR